MTPDALAAPTTESTAIMKEAPVILEVAGGALSGVMLSRVISGLGPVQAMFGDWSLTVGAIGTLVAGLIAYHFSGKGHPHAANFFMGMSIGGAAVFLNEILTAFLGMNILGGGGQQEQPMVPAMG